MARILISVTNKDGLEKFSVLAERYEIISTGGTADALKKLGIPCTPIEDITGFPEMLEGRLKTLHPKVHGGILADRYKPEHMQAIRDRGIAPIDMVVVNLYDFKGKPGIEQIDIGGPTLLRAAAKNGKSVLPVIDPKDYDMVIRKTLANEAFTPLERCGFVRKVFRHTAQFDADIGAWMDDIIRREKSFL